MFEKFRRVIQKQENKTSSQEKWEITYPVQETKYPWAFYLEDGSAYISMHFENGQFGHPETKNPINSVSEFLEKIKKDLNVTNLTVSCCHTDSARAVFENISGVTLIGSGDNETQTKYNSRNHTITVCSI